MKTDYPELEGKEVKYYTGWNWVYGKVSGCNYHIGISIENDNQYLLCLNGEKSPIHKKCENPIPRQMYRKLFHQIVKQIQNGIIQPNFIFQKTNYYQLNTHNPEVTDCPYAQ